MQKLRSLGSVIFCDWVTNRFSCLYISKDQWCAVHTILDALHLQRSSHWLVDVRQSVRYFSQKFSRPWKWGLTTKLSTRKRNYKMPSRYHDSQWYQLPSLRQHGPVLISVARESEINWNSSPQMLIVFIQTTENSTATVIWVFFISVYIDSAVLYIPMFIILWLLFVLLSFTSRVTNTNL